VALTDPYKLTRELIRRHRDYWTEERIAGFWHGRQFRSPDEGKELSYHLARFVLYSLYDGGNTPRRAMEEFFLTAKHPDAGQAAAIEVFGIRLGECVESLLGEGNWDPAPPPPKKPADAPAN
jgi:hypothetical protein